MIVSVIIPAYNAVATIEGCLKSIHTQTYHGRIEIVLVDNGSTDDTVAIARRMGVDKIVLSPDTTVYGARNEAVAQSKGDVLAFIDSDCVADPDWLTCGLEALEDCDVVSGHILPQETDRRLLYFYDKYVARAEKGRNGAPVNIAAGNAIMKREIFETIGGFNPAIRTAGDSIFSMQARSQGFRIKHSLDCIVYHPVDSFKRRLRGLFREGEGSALKSSLRYADQSIAKKTSKRLSQFFMQIGLDLHSIERARKEKSYSSAMAFRLAVFSIWLHMLSYLAILSARYLKPLNRRLARR